MRRDLSLQHRGTAEKTCSIEVDVHQAIRALDVAVLGPFSIWFGWRATGMPTGARAALIGYGITTIAYNAWGFYWRSGLPHSAQISR